MIMRCRIAWVAMMVALAASSALAWNHEGHLLTAYVAYQQLDEPTRARVDALLDHVPHADVLFQYVQADAPEAERRLERFMTASAWADEIRTRPHAKPSPLDPDRKLSHPSWHFVNRPYVRPGDTTYADADLTTPAPNAITAFNDQLHVLTTSDDPTARAIAFCWVSHLAGDLHQPLHCATLLYDHEFMPPQGDRGGNSIRVHGHADDLHAVWDDALGNEYHFDVIIKRGKQLLDDYPRDAFTADEVAAAAGQWADESYHLAATVAYSILPPTGRLDDRLTLTPAYRETVKKTAARQIALAGYRLAHVIEQAFK